MKKTQKIISVLLLSIALFTQVHAAEFEGVGGVPANPDPNVPNSKEWFVYTLKPGDTKEDSLLVINNSDRSSKVILYSADSTPSTDGGFALKQRVETNTDVGKWITLSKTEVALDPHGSELVPFKIAVPKTPLPDVGEHTGGILIQKEDQQTGAATGGMQLLTRVGVRVYITIPGQIIKKLELQKFDVTFDPSRKKYIASITVRNTGNVSQDVVIETRVTNLWDWVEKIPYVHDWFFKDYPITNERDLQVLRDDSLTSNFEFDEPILGKLKVEADVLYDNKSQKLTATPVIVDVPVDRNVIIFLIILAAFLVCVFALIILRRSDKHKEEKKLAKLKKMEEKIKAQEDQMKEVIKKKAPAKKTTKKKKPRKSS